MNVGNVIKNCFAGIYALLRDPAGTVCLLVLATVSFLCFRGKVSDVAFSACCTLIPAVIAMLKHKSFSGSDIDQCPPGTTAAPDTTTDPTVTPAPAPAPTVDTTTTVNTTPVAVQPAVVPTTGVTPGANLPARGQL